MHASWLPPQLLFATINRRETLPCKRRMIGSSYEAQGMGSTGNFFQCMKACTFPTAQEADEE
jgi:hypothetical protein